MSRLECTGVNIKMKDGSTLTLSLDEAKELHEILNNLVGSRPSVVIERPVFPRLYRYWDASWSGDTALLSMIEGSTSDAKTQNSD